MSFLQHELSRFLGRPIEGYVFEWSSEVRRYCAGGRDVGDYVATTITRGRFTLTRDMAKSDIQIRVPRDNEIAQMFVGWPPEHTIKVSVLRIHKQEPASYVAVWTGRVLSCTFSGDEASLSCESIYTSLTRAGLRATYQKKCRHFLYDGFCGLVESDWQASLSSVTKTGERTMHSTPLGSQPDGYWIGGILRRENGEMRYVVGHVGDGIVIEYPFKNFTGEEPLVVSAGCDRTIETCHSRFNNAINHGGFPYIKNKNPFSGDKVA